MTAEVVKVPAEALASGFPFTSIAPGARVRTPVSEIEYRFGLFP